MRLPRVSLLFGYAAILLAGWGVGELADWVQEKEHLAAYDASVTTWLAGHRSPGLNQVMLAVTELGAARLTLPVVLLACLLLPLRGKRWPTLLSAAMVLLGTSLMVYAIKVLMGRARPDPLEAVTTAGGFSFPSGHSAQAMAVWGFIAWLVVSRVRSIWARVAVWAGAAVIIIGVGCSRMYLGVHWLTDVLGGFLLAGAWLITVLMGTYYLFRRSSSRAAAGLSGSDAAGSAPPDR